VTTGAGPARSEGPPVIPRGIRTLALIIGAFGLLLLPFVLFGVLVTCGCTAPSQPPELPRSPIVGAVVAIDQVSLTQVNSFGVRMADGKTVTLKVGSLDNPTQFSLSHLATHMATGEPIRAFYRLENGEPVVYHLEDAVPASPVPNAT
jgi:hypothetical protein